jgi:glutaredoxin
MDILKIAEKGYTIFTKENCKYCTLVKELLKGEEKEVIECDAFLKEDRAGFLKWVEERIHFEYKTFPMVFYNGVFIGGYNETKIHYHKHHLTFEEIEYNEQQDQRFHMDGRLLS